MVVRLYGCAVVRLCGYMVLGLYGCAVVRLCGFRVIRFYGKYIYENKHLKRKDMRNIVFALAVLSLAACSDDGMEHDATGVFEATEVIVSAEQTGRLLYFNADEGAKLSAGQQVGLIDTVQLQLRAMQLGATKEAYASRRPDIAKQIAETRQQLDKAELEVKRYAALVRDNAADRKMLDDAESSVRVLRRRLEAQKSQLDNTAGSLNRQMDAAEIERRMVIDQLSKCRITSPVGGTVLEKYAETGEYAVPGKPLFKIADVSDMYLRAYVAAPQLTSLKIGQQVKVYSDLGDDGSREYQGTVTWISDKAEFTPKTIQTRDERANLVYAVKIRVKNTDGQIKIGMYGEADFLTF